MLPPGVASLQFGLVGSTALCTDRYELTMLSSALRDGSASRRCVFEVFGRRLPEGRRYGVVAGTARLLDAIDSFRFDEAELDFLTRTGVIDAETRNWLADYRFGGDVDGYAEGELYFPGSPVLTVSGSFAEAVVLETLALSVLNHDCAVASAATRMVTAAGDRPLQVALLRDGKRVDGLPTLDESRAHLRRVLVSVPWEGLKLSRGEPAIPTTALQGRRP